MYNKASQAIARGYAKRKTGHLVTTVPSAPRSNNSETLDEYIVANGDPDPLWPLVLTLRYRALNVKPGAGIESSSRCVEDLEIIAKAREGAGILVHWIIADGQGFVKKADLVDL
ncbi:hypothetical protein EDD85DRAFT_796318 [Armillaria nabsnona]|nr:hypothetical protein EDD85DRAFT_796318 [Armillaria nabsnona]